MRFGWLTLAHSASPEADYAHVHDLVEQEESSPEPTRQRALLDDLVRSTKHRLRDRQPERLRGLEVDYQGDLGGLLDGQVGGLGSSQNLVPQIGSAPKSTRESRTVRNEAT